MAAWHDVRTALAWPFGRSSAVFSQKRSVIAAPVFTGIAFYRLQCWTPKLYTIKSGMLTVCEWVGSCGKPMATISKISKSGRHCKLMCFINQWVIDVVASHPRRKAVSNNVVVISALAGLAKHNCGGCCVRLPTKETLSQYFHHFQYLIAHHYVNMHQPSSTTIFLIISWSLS